MSHEVFPRCIRSSTRCSHPTNHNTVSARCIEFATPIRFSVSTEIEGDLSPIIRIVASEAIKTYEQAFDIANSTGYVRVAGAIKLRLAKAHFGSMQLTAARTHLEAADTYISDGKPVDLYNGVRMRWAKLYRLEGDIDVAKSTIDALLSDLGYPASNKGAGLNKVLVEAAEIYCTLGDYARAEVFADALIDLLSEQAMSDAPGNLRLGRAGLLRAAIRLEGGDARLASEDLREALPHLRYSLDPGHALLQEAEALEVAIEAAGTL